MIEEVNREPSPVTMTSQTQILRIPKGLWADLEETVIQQDRQFLTDVARSLGLSVPEVLRRCLGTGAVTPIPVLWISSPDQEETTDTCPWWSSTPNGALWRPCHRSRMAPTLPCCRHEGISSGSIYRLASDPFITALPKRWPVRFRSAIVWADPDGIEPAVYEDGRPELEGRFRFIQHRGKRIALFIKNTTLSE